MKQPGHTDVAKIIDEALQLDLDDRSQPTAPGVREEDFAEMAAAFGTGSLPGTASLRGLGR